MDKKAQDIGRNINNVARAEASSGPSMGHRSFQVNSFVERAYVTLATGVYGTRGGAKKDKGMLETEVRESECRSRRM